VRRSSSSDVAGESADEDAGGEREDARDEDAAERGGERDMLRGGRGRAKARARQLDPALIRAEAWKRQGCRRSGEGRQ
jgi:hypothetical protein